MFKAYKRYFDFEGRSSRSEYWLFALFCLIVAVAYTAVMLLLRDPYGRPTGAAFALMALYGVFAVATLIPSLSVSVRRLHDTDRSGWLLLLSLIPLIGSIIVLVFFVLPGTKGANRFGVDPLGKTDVEAFS